jgi:predicted SprT family Zn-dependent metalloprotease
MNKKKMKALASPTNLDLFAPPIEQLPILVRETLPGELPSVDDLYQRFREYNIKYFAGKLPTPCIRYSGRLLAAGLFVRGRQEIVISRKYHRLFPDEIDDTLKHEMIHIIHFNHNKEFKQEADRIGASYRAKSHKELKLPARYIYFCRVCKTEYPRRKRLISASCGKCSPSRFDPKYKLNLRARIKR